MGAYSPFFEDMDAENYACIFADGQKKINIDVVKRVCDKCLRVQQTTFMQYKSLLAPVQWRLLVGLAKTIKLSY
ncbi:MAG: hypothetical protein LBR67_06715 [Dysgonamonadaceae bacterium]|jgi:hypothetical protein|nr:hypothetical protein [Dysgonamonadaceae bacterium]